jgi:hypothetical protein
MVKCRRFRNGEKSAIGFKETIFERFLFLTPSFYLGDSRSSNGMI